jgi:hypothetical protein
MHGPDGQGADVGGPRPRAAGAGPPLVGVGRLRVVYERRGSRRRRGATRALRRDGRAGRRRALRAERVRRFRAPLRLRLRSSPLRPGGSLGPRKPRRPLFAALDARARRQYRNRRWPGLGRLGFRRGTASRAVGARPAARHGRAVPVRFRGLEARPRPLRRAPRAHLHHRARRVDRRHRRRRRSGRGRGTRRRGHARNRSRRRALVVVLRRGRAGGGAAPVPRQCGSRAERACPRLILVPALSHDRGRRVACTRTQEDSRRRW